MKNNTNILIDIINFSKSFQNQIAVDDLSFSVNKGEIFSFLGSNGSGKTTTIRCLLNIYAKDKGSLLINQKPYNFSMSENIGYLPEERGIYTRARVEELFHYFGRLRGISEQNSKNFTNLYLKRVGLHEHRQKMILQLSSGMQQKVQLGLAMQHNPELLILDEPFKGLDPINRQLYTDIFKELKEQGVTIFYSTHVIDEAQKLTDRLIIIHNGKKVAYGTTTEVRKQYGNEIIHVEFAKILPNLPNLYSAKVVGKTAEITPNKNVETEEILKSILKAKITSFKLDYPSLNEVFLKIKENND